MEASARKKKRPLAAIPENLEELSKPELIKIIKSLQSQVQKKHKGDEVVDAKALQAMRKRLRDKVVRVNWSMRDTIEHAGFSVREAPREEEDVALAAAPPPARAARPVSYTHQTLPTKA